MKTLLRTLCLIVIAASATLAAPEKSMASKAAIDADVRAASEKFATQVRGARELAAKAEGVLVFPSVVKAGFGFGGEYGERCAVGARGADELLQYHLGVVRLPARRAVPHDIIMS